MLTSTGVLGGTFSGNSDWFSLSGGGGTDTVVLSGGNTWSGSQFDYVSGITVLKAGTGGDISIGSDANFGNTGIKTIDLTGLSASNSATVNLSATTDAVTINLGTASSNTQTWSR